MVFTTIPPQRLILGDSAYPLEEYIIKPFTDRGHLSYFKTKFNLFLRKSRVVVENPVGRLKGRFQCLSKRLSTSVEITVIIASGCCVLHNICEMRNQNFLEE